MKKLYYRIALALLILLATLAVVTAQSIHFAHVTDTHVGCQSGAEDLSLTVKDINRQTDIDFVLLTGDITEFGSDTELLQARKIIDRLNKPWYIVPGNHDSKWSESGNNSFVKTFGSERFSFLKSGIQFIGTASGPNMRMAPGLVPREQILFLDSVLTHLELPGQPVIFVNHYPLDESLANWYTVIDLLKKVNIKATLLGHGHTNKLYNFEGIPGVMGRSNLKTAKAEPGYNLVTIEKDTMFYQERLSAGKTLQTWCKVPLNSKAGISQKWPRPDYSVNNQYPRVKAVWSVRENSDIGTGFSLRGNVGVYANTAGEIIAINTRTGEKKWTFRSGGKIYSTPAINGGKVICASTDQNIYCLDIKSGQLIWKFPTHKPIVASPAIENNSVFIGSSEGIFRCIDLMSGKLVWKFDSVKNFTECRPLILSKIVCFGSWGNTFYALNKSDGKLLWKREKYSNRMLSPAAVWPVASNGKIFLVAPDRHMTALDENTGREIWDSGKYSCRESIGISTDGKIVYIKNMSEGNIDAFYSTTEDQKLVWECKADLGYEIAPSPIVESGEFVFIPTTSGIVVAVDRKTHLVVWKHKISNALINSVLPIGKHKIIVSAMDGRVECLSFKRILKKAKG